jgi:predicted nucleic acid-binding protein
MLTILDTNVVSALRQPRRNPNLAAWLAAQSSLEIALASFTVTEIEFGIAHRPEADAFALHLTEWLDRIIATDRILPLEAEAARLLGRMYATSALRHLAMTLPGMARPRFGGDLIIAATAITNRARVATRNMRDFGLIAQHFPQLRAIDPFTGAEL